jgi:Putative binding domain, N-terminal
VPVGTYVYGDYCSGEIFAWNGSSQSVLLASGLRISSFGEGQLGELYVVDLGGTVSRIVSSATCQFSISPARLTFARDGGTGMVAVTASAGCAWTAESNASWITVTAGTPGTGDGTVTFSVAPYTGKPKNRNGTITIAGQTFSVRQSK